MGALSWNFRGSEQACESLGSWAKADWPRAESSPLWEDEIKLSSWLCLHRRRSCIEQGQVTKPDKEQKVNHVQKPLNLSL